MMLGCRTISRGCGRRLRETTASASYLLCRYAAYERLAKAIASRWEMTGFAIDGPYSLNENASSWVLAPQQPMMLQASVFNRDADFACSGFWSPLRYRDDTHLFIKMGLSGPVVAVAGGGALMNDDDQPENRLSATHDKSRQGTEMPVLMNRELLDYFGEELMPQQEKLLTARLAGAHLALARLSLEEGDYVDFARNLFHSVTARPANLLESLSGKLR